MKKFNLFLQEVCWSVKFDKLRSICVCVCVHELDVKWKQHENITLTHTRTNTHILLMLIHHHISQQRDLLILKRVPNNNKLNAIEPNAFNTAKPKVQEKKVRKRKEEEQKEGGEMKGKLRKN